MFFPLLQEITFLRDMRDVSMLLGPCQGSAFKFFCCTGFDYKGLVQNVSYSVYAVENFWATTQHLISLILLDVFSGRHQQGHCLR